MGFFNRLTTFGKAIVLLVIIAVLGTAAWFIMEKTGKQLPNFSTKSLKSSEYDMTIAVDTYTGWAPIIWGNGGLQGTKDSYFSKKFGIRLLIRNMDDFDACRAALKKGDIDAAFVTLDSYPVEMSSNGTMTDMRYFMIHNFSVGADAIVVTKNINTVADLKGKRIAFSEASASHSLLIKTLETAGLKGTDITQVKTGYGSDVAQAFKAKQVDAAVVFTPDDDDCVTAVPGAKVLTSTKQASTLITDGFIAKKEWLDNNSETVRKFIQALLWANSEITYKESCYNDACQAFSDALDVPVEFALNVGKKINFATLEDNANWFGLGSDYRGQTGLKLYTEMSAAYTELGLAEKVLPWYRVSTTHFIEELLAENDLTNNQMANATRAKVFTAPTTEMTTAKEFSDKRVVINFPVNGYTLDNTAKSIIDMEFAPIASQFNQVRIRVEGNTDNTGNIDYNTELSKKRAKAVIDYLIHEHGIDRNRFIVVGNGPKRAIQDGVSGSNVNYRTTDFQLIDR